MTPLEDQQIAGLIMWVPAGIVYAGAALALMALWIHNSAKGGPDGTQAAHH
jgi:cytochrome c oxidase assembly factor CtaG